MTTQKMETLLTRQDYAVSTASTGKVTGEIDSEQQYAARFWTFAEVTLRSSRK